MKPDQANPELVKRSDLEDVLSVLLTKRDLQLAFDDFNRRNQLYYEELKSLIETLRDH